MASRRFLEVLVGVVLLVVTVVFLSCGPAAPSGQNDAPAGDDGKPGETKVLTPEPEQSGETKTPTQEPEKPTVEIKPPSSPPVTYETEKPAGEGTKTPGSSPDASTSEHTTSQPAQTEEQATTSKGTAVAPAELTADVCKNLSDHDNSPKARAIRDDPLYFSNCTDTLRDDMHGTCGIAEPSENALWPHEEQTCMRSYLDEVKSYTFRKYLLHECWAIGLETVDELVDCRRNTAQRDRDLEEMTHSTVGELRSLVDSSSKVAQAEENTRTCIDASEDKEPLPDLVDLMDTDRVLFWLFWSMDPRPDEEIIEQLTGLDSLRREKLEQRVLLVDKCAAKAGVYDAVYEVLMSALRSYVRKEPEKVEYWVKTGWIETLEQQGASALRPLGNRE